MQSRSITRRTFVAQTSSALALASGIPGAAWGATPPDSRQAMGTRVGDVTPTTAIVWARLTQHATRNNDGFVFEGRANDKKNKGKALPHASTEKQLLELEFVIDKLADIYEPHDARLWLFARQRLLDDQVPAELIQQGRVDEVLASVNQLLDGVHL